MDLEVFAWFVFGTIALFCGVVIARPKRKRPMATRKQTVFLPRRTVWDRAATYYRGDE